MLSRHRSTTSARVPIALGAPAFVAAFVAIVPLGYLVVRATERGWGRFAEVLFRERTLELLAKSLTLALVVTVACVVLGVALAWLVVASDLPGRRACAVVAALPLAVPTYVAGYAWISVAPDLAGFRGAALVLTLASYPYVFLPVAASLRGLDPALVEASRSLGDTSWRTFVRVTLPHLRPAIGAGALLVALYVLSDFGAVSIMRYKALTQAIFTSYRASFDRVPAAVLGCLLVTVTIGLLLAEGRTRGRARYARLGAGATRPMSPVPLGPLRVPCLIAVAAVTALSLGVPGGSLGYWLARGSSAAIDGGAVLAAASSSLYVSLLGAVVTVVLAVPVGILAARHRGRVAASLERAAYVGHALPGVVVGLSVVALSVRFARPLYQRTPTLVLAYAVLFLPLAVGAVRASVGQSPPALEEVARSLGRTPRAVLRTITLPLAGPGVGAGAALVFLTCMKELPATLMLRPTGMETLATSLWSATGIGAYAAAAPYAAVLVLLSAIPTYLLGHRTGALQGGSDR